MRRSATEAAAALLAEHVTSTLSPEVRDRLVESAGGNPLALIELSGLLSAEQLAGRAALPDPLPQSAEIERVYLERARRLPAAAQRLLLLVAADDTGSLATVFRAAATLGIEPDALEAAELAGLVRAFDGRVEFRHPLVRSTLYGDATFAQRQAVHRALAAVLDAEQDADRRAWHRAAASLGEDDEVAGELEHAARRARRRSGFAAAGRALERAAELSSDDEARGRRLVAAAQDAWLAGRPEHALALLDRARGLVSDPAVRAEDDASARHDRAAVRGPGGGRDDPRRRRRGDRARRARRRRSRCSSRPRRPRPTRATRRRSSSSAGGASALSGDDDPDQRFTVDVIVGIGSLLAGDTARGVPLLREALALAERFQDPRRLVHAGACAGYLGEEATEHELYGRAVARARESGAVGTLPYVLEYLARSEAVDGRYATAAAHATEGLRLARETGQQNSVCHLLASLALIAALQGREEECRSHAARGPRAWRRRGGSATSRRSPNGRWLASISGLGQAGGGAGAARPAGGGGPRQAATRS